jgi:hypothetical protein
MSTIDIGISLPVKQTPTPPVSVQRKPAPHPQVPAQRATPVLDDFYVGSTKLEAAAQNT